MTGFTGRNNQNVTLLRCLMRCIHDAFLKEHQRTLIFRAMLNCQATSKEVTCGFEALLGVM